LDRRLPAGPCPACLTVLQIKESNLISRPRSQNQLRVEARSQITSPPATKCCLQWVPGLKTARRPIAKYGQRHLLPTNGLLGLRYSQSQKSDIIPWCSQTGIGCAHNRKLCPSWWCRAPGQVEDRGMDRACSTAAPKATEISSAVVSFVMRPYPKSPENP
jgi:hypothetical protein